MLSAYGDVIFGKMLPSMTCDSKIFYSPGVGRFWPFPNRRHTNEGFLIGYLIRLNEKFPIVIPDLNGRIEYLVDPGTFVHAGTPIARLCDVVNTSVPSNDSSMTQWIVSPTDGFLTCTDETGIPLKKNGDTLHKGDMIAVLEFMKIRMDILYDGPNNASFDHYQGELHRSIKKGECIAAFILNKE